MLHYKIIPAENSAPWIVFLHGAGGNSKTWNYQTDAFRGSFNLLVLDLRDHGKSQLQAPGNRYTFKLIANDIFSVLDKEAIRQAYFITLSFGSVLLQDLSMRRPGLVAGAVFAGGIFKANRLVRMYVGSARMLNRVLSYPQMYRLFSWLLMPGRNHQRSRRIYQRQARLLNRQAYLRWITLYDEFFELLQRFYHQVIDFPAMAVMGSQDHIFLGTARRFVSSQGDNVRLKIIPAAGHICNIDKPDHFNEITLEFFRHLTETAGQSEANKASRYSPAKRD